MQCSHSQRDAITIRGDGALLNQTNQSIVIQLQALQRCISNYNVASLINKVVSYAFSILGYLLYR